MAIFKCKMCGGDLKVTADDKIIECEYCGTTQTVPDGSNEKKTKLFNRANRLRMDNEFDKAAGVYESIVSEFPEEAEGYWGLVLCSYGIEYVDDAKTGKKIPTCHRTLTSSVMDDDNFNQACENAEFIARTIYREEAKAIDKLQQQIIAVVENEEPYDVFICYKETDDITKSRTEDSLIAQDIYTELIKEGYKVFFSRVTLRDKAGTEYEPYIYAALKSAKIMLAIGTKFDYYDAVWVKNEWSRYIYMMADDSSKHLIPCFKNLDAYDIPKEFKNLQALDMGEVTFFKNLTDSVDRFIPKQKEQEKLTETSSKKNNSAIDSLIKRAFMFLEDGDWQSANEYCEKALDINPECAEAYLGKLMAELNVHKQDALCDYDEPFDDRNNYQKVTRFADGKLKNELNEVVEKHRSLLARKANEFTVALEKTQFRNAQMGISSGYTHTVGLKSDGTVVTTKYIGDKNVYYGQCEVSTWSDIVAISAGDYHTIGLKSDGTVVSVGDSFYGGCNVSKWNDIVAISTKDSHTVGLKSDGTVVATKYTGDEKFYAGQCDVSNWSDIIAISAGSYHTVGLKSDGTVVATKYTGDEEYYEGQCEVADWKYVVAISAGGGHTVGLKSDGTVVATKYIGGKEYNFGQCEVADWKDIVAISAGKFHTIGLKSDGTVVAVGNNKHGQCNVSNWKDVVAISAGDVNTIGLKADGTVIATGFKEMGACDVSSWTDIILPIIAETRDEFESKKKELDQKRNAVVELAKKKPKKSFGKEKLFLIFSQLISLELYIHILVVVCSIQSL